MREKEERCGSAIVVHRQRIRCELPAGHRVRHQYTRTPKRAGQYWRQLIWWDQEPAERVYVDPPERGVRSP